MTVRFRRARIVILSLSILSAIVPPTRATEFDEIIKLQKQVHALYAAGKYQQAIPLAQQLVARAEKAFQDEPTIIATCLNYLASVYKNQGRYTEAEPLYKRAVAIGEKSLGAAHPDVAASLNNLAELYRYQGRYTEAEPLYKRCLEIEEKSLAADDPGIALTLNNWGILHYLQGHYAEAESLYQRSLAIREKVFGAWHSDVGQSRNNLALLYEAQGRYAEAEPLHKQGLAIREKALGSEHPDVAESLNNLAELYRHQGRFAEAEPLYKRAQAIKEKVLGSEHPSVAFSLNNLALVYDYQGRYAEAEPRYKRALAIWEKALGGEHPLVAISLNNLATLYFDHGRYGEAELLHKRALAIREKALGAEHPNVASSLENLAIVYNAQGRHAEAEPLYQRSLAIQEKALGAEHPNVARSLHNLASLYWDQGRITEVAPLLDRSIRIKDQAGVAPGGRYIGYRSRALLAWRQGHHEDAIADLNQAMQLAEEQRTLSSGGEQERAQAFAQFGTAYELMVQWQTALGDVGAALAAVERSRARSLVDQMSAAHVDLLAGIPADQAQPLRNQEAAALTRVATVEKQLQLVRSKKDLSTEDRERQVTVLQKDLVSARQAYVEAFAAIRNASPAYRQMIGQNFKPTTLDELQARVSKDDRLILEYVLGVKSGYVLVIPPVGQKARIEKLALNEEQAAKLGAKAGPLTAAVMKQIMANEDETGVLQLLRNQYKSAQAVDRLAVLWHVLVPESEREAVTSDQLKQLIVIPDGPLTLLPFDTLVVEAGESPRYLLDAGPPIVSAPSATLLYNLMGQTAANSPPGKQPVLSVGDAIYQSIYAKPADNRNGNLMTEMTPRSRYGALDGDLANLPHSGIESEWVTEVFKKQGIAAGRLTKEKATEANVRFNISNRRIVHLACHGLADQSHGNLFGALAFTPGPQGAANPADDGFLTLGEIYGLKLQGTDLSILSACNTNYGPEQKGEGVWSLSRGFLVAGSKRVVASNWLVDDEAAASLISYYCAGLAQSGRNGDVTDYAKSLQAAKRWVRNQEKWRSPYYWGTFVLVGPN